MHSKEKIELYFRKIIEKHECAQVSYDDNKLIDSYARVSEEDRNGNDNIVSWYCHKTHSHTRININRNKH